MKEKTKRVKGLKHRHYTLGFFLIILGLLLFVIYKPLKTEIATWQSRPNSTKTNPVKETPKPSPAKIFSPTPKSTPKPIVYYGFCKNVPILLYHHIQPADQARAKGQQSLSVDDKIFDKQMGYLASSGYHTISVDELVQDLIKHQSPPNKSIVITLDDGYEDAYTYAYPIFSKYHLIGNLMIPTGLLGNPDYMSWDELKRVVDTGLIFAYDHTWSHANLTALSDDKAKREILSAKTQLEEHLGKPVNVFAYPYGSENQRVINILQTNGFIGALSTIPGFTQCDSFIMSLHRTRIGNSQLSSYGL